VETSIAKHQLVKTCFRCNTPAEEPLEVVSFIWSASKLYKDWWNLGKQNRLTHPETNLTLSGWNIPFFYYFFIWWGGTLQVP
jgi:hypothetical protein